MNDVAWSGLRRALALTLTLTDAIWRRRSTATLLGSKVTWLLTARPTSPSERAPTLDSPSTIE